MKFLHSLVISLSAGTLFLGSLALPFETGRGLQTDPKTDPDKFAWEVFTRINKSAATPGNNDTVWETWADTGLVYGNPNIQPIWPTHAPQPLRFRATAKDLFQRLNKQIKQSPGAMPLLKGSFLNQQLIPFILPIAENGGNEVRMNFDAFKYIVDNQLWYQEGQKAMFQSGGPITFPKGAIEIKAKWKVIALADQPRYHWQKGTDGNLYGLIALHITTKDLPNWFWATFEHVDNPNRCQAIGCTDAFGGTGANLSPAVTSLLSNAGLGKEWQNYRLTSSQVDFLRTDGTPTRSGNSILEAGFESTASCITCHSKAAYDKNGEFNSFFKSFPPPVGDTGTPDPKWLTDAMGNKIRLQSDFVWSMFEALPRQPSPLRQAQTVSFAHDIRPLFQPIDIQHMKPFGVKLDDYAYMSDPNNAKLVYDRLTGAKLPIMPPSGKWPDDKLALFKAWMDAGFPQ